MRGRADEVTVANLHLRDSLSMKSMPDRSGVMPAASGQVPDAFTAALRGALGFAVVSVAAFCVWAFGGRWFRGNGGEGAMYAAIAAVFIGLSGLLLHPLILGRNRVRRFYGVFAPAFVAYAVVWSGFWFWLKFGLGEWLGAFLGSLAFVALSAWRLGRWHRFGVGVGVFFVLHTAGYFAGGQSMAWLMHASRQKPVPFLDPSSLVVLAKLSWGLFYGLGLGAGLGYVFSHFQAPATFAAAPPRPSDT